MKITLVWIFGWKTGRYFGFSIDLSILAILDITFGYLNKFDFSGILDNFEYILDITSKKNNIFKI